MLKKDDTSVRIPLVGSQNTRLLVTGAGSGSGYVGIGIVGTMVVGASVVPNSDQRFVNVIPTKVEDRLTGSKKFYLYKRPGLETHSTPASGQAGSVIKVWTGQGTGEAVISAFGSTSTIYNDTSSIGTLDGLCNAITETIVGTTPTLTFTTDSNSAFYYPEGGSMTEITSANFPSNNSKTITGTFVHMDGYAFILATDGTLWNSDLNSIANWTSTSFINCNMYPDMGVGLARYKDFIVAFGRETIEFFRNAGNALGSPLEKVKEAFIKIGCLGPESMCQFEDNIAWVASSDTGSTSIYVLNGYQPLRISDDVVDARLATRGGSMVYLTTAKIFGQTYIYVIFGNNTMVFCVETGIWHEWAPVSGGSVLWHQFAANSSSGPVIYAISRDSTTGKVFRINPITATYQDNGSNYTTTIQTSKIDLGNELRKFLHRFTVVGDTSASSSTLSVQWSDDDYLTFNTARSISLTSNNKYLTNCGSFRRRAFKITETSAVPFRLEALELRVSQGLH